MGADGFPSNFGENPEENVRRDQESAQNHCKIMHASAKHYFEVVWAHMGACRAVGSRFPCFFMLFHGFGDPGRPSWPRAARAAPKQSRSEDLEDFIRISKNLGGFYKNFEESGRIL